MAYRGRGPRFVPPPEEQHRINRKIRAPQVRLIGADGGQVGIVPIAEAIELAEEAQLDLVEIAATASPPVCRILDYGKFKYQQHKKETEAKKKEKAQKHEGGENRGQQGPTENEQRDFGGSASDYSGSNGLL